MANILSLQSHVAYGYVGNRAAIFPLQRLGHEVIGINTVQFSNHTGYGHWSGDIMSLEHIDNIFHGLLNLGMLDCVHGVLTGYLGDKTLGDVLLKWLAYIRNKNPNLVYCCDPVIGDIGRGIFVRPGVPEFFRDQILEHVTILTPNQFELTYLTGIEIRTLTDAKAACKQLHTRGVRYVLVTSLMRDDAATDNQIEMLVSDGTNKEHYLVASPRLDLAIPPNGAGDMTAAIFLAKFLEDANIKSSLAHTMSAVYDVFKLTLLNNQRELAIIAAQDYLLNPSNLFKVKLI